MGIYVSLVSFWLCLWCVPGHDGGMWLARRDRGFFARTLAKTLVDPMLGAG